MPRAVRPGPPEEKPHLRRNQACLQCRKRKLKCDAGRPCTCCRKSHANVIAQAAMKGEPFVTEPTCTYDDMPANRTKSSSGKSKASEEDITDADKEHSIDDAPVPRALSANVTNDPLPSKFERESAYEGKIESQDTYTSNYHADSSTSTYTSQLRSQNGHPPSSSSFDSPAFPGSRPSSRRMGSPSPNSYFQSTPHYKPTQYDEAPDPTVASRYPGADSAYAHPSGYYQNQTVQKPYAFAIDPSLDPNSLPGQPFLTTDVNSNGPYSYSSWPPSLPPAQYTLHIVESFFNSNALAPRIIHRPSFMRALTSEPQYQQIPPPTDQRAFPGSSAPETGPTFPSVALLHAICALGISFSPPEVVDGILPIRSSSNQGPEAFRALRQQSITRFADHHAEQSRRIVDEDVRRSRRLLECVQTTVILGWFYYFNHRPINTWTIAGLALRQIIPIGINRTSDTSHGLFVDSWRDRSLQPAAGPRGAEDLEVRRATFWLAHMLDTHQTVSTGWSGAIDEADISQTLPGILDDFENCRTIPIARQSLESPDLFSTHLRPLTDGFSLHIKASILIGRVARFNSRLLRMFAHHPDYARPRSSTGPNEQNGQIPDYIDARGSAQFIELETALHTFRASLFKDYKDYVFPVGNPELDNGSKGSSLLDANLYAAHMIPAAAIILLHDPHVEMHKSSCDSAIAVLTAARFILDTARSLLATQLDFSLLVHTTALYWSKAAAVFIRFYEDALERQQVQEASAYKVEADTMKLAVARMGERVPAAESLSKTVQDWIDSASAIGSRTAPSADNVWKYLRYSERKRIGLHPAYLGDSHVD